MPIPDATPDRVLLGTLVDPRLRLRAPLALEVRQADEQVGVWSEELEQLGIGRHLTAALTDMQRTLAEVFLVLDVEAREGRLAPRMERAWQALAAYIERRS